MYIQRFFAIFENFVFQNFVKLFWISKFEENFAKHEIKIFAKISQNNENKIFCSHPVLLHNPPYATGTQYSPSPPVC